MTVVIFYTHKGGFSSSCSKSVHSRFAFHARYEVWNASSSPSAAPSALWLAQLVKNTCLQLMYTRLADMLKLQCSNHIATMLKLQRSSYNAQTCSSYNAQTTLLMWSSQHFDRRTYLAHSHSLVSSSSQLCSQYTSCHACKTMLVWSSKHFDRRTYLARSHSLVSSSSQLCSQYTSCHACKTMLVCSSKHFDRRTYLAGSHSLVSSSPRFVRRTYLGTLAWNGRFLIEPWLEVATTIPPLGRFTPSFLKSAGCL
jgi:hypothetical protein